MKDMSYCIYPHHYNGVYVVYHFIREYTGVDIYAPITPKDSKFISIHQMVKEELK